MSFNVSAAGAMSPTTTSHARPDRTKVMQPVADLLGMSVDDLRKAQRSGTTLDQVASAKGVSHMDLVAAIKKGLQDARPSGTTANTGATPSNGTDPLDKMAEDIAAGRRPQGTGRSRRADGDGDDASGSGTSPLDSLSSSLKMSTTDLLTALKGGTSLSDLATKQGMNASDVLNAVGTGLVLKTYA